MVKNRSYGTPFPTTTILAIILRITHDCVIFKQIATNYLVMSWFTDMLLT